MEEHIRANAETVVKELGKLKGEEFGYTRESVEWLEGYIERLKNSGEFDSTERKNRLISVFGSFLGECIVRCYGGAWRQLESGEWGVAFRNEEMAFTENNMAFPFAKVAKQIDNGLEDGIASFFSVIPILFTDHSGPLPPAAKKPWWKVW